jgi:hypothetical protein
VSGGSTQDGESGRGRSHPLFDPVAGMRAMADIQADGLRAASELLERMLAPDHEPQSPPPQSSGREYAALVEAWADLLQRVAAGLAAPVDSGALAVPVDSDAVGPPVRLVFEDREQVQSTSTELWLHNGTSASVGPLALRCTALTAPNGRVLKRAQVRFEPEEIALLPPRSSRAVLLRIVASGRLRAGIFRGTIQADGAPKLWLPVEAAVGPC